MVSSCEDDRVAYRPGRSTMNPLRWAAALVLLLACTQASAQITDYPSKTVTIVVPTAPGGMLGLLGRLVATRLEQRFGKTFIVENRPGAGTAVGATMVARAAPDGYTLLIGATSTLATNVTLHKK